MSARLLRPAAGIAAAILFLELGLRVFATPADAPPARVHADSMGGDVIVRRQLQEDVAVSHFSAAGARLTGHAPARAGMQAVILGDSYVVAVQVDDARTMGGQLESIARSSGMPLDVRQYGWSNATPAQYVMVAGDVRRWRPRRVFVVVSDNDMDYRTNGAAGPRFHVDSRGVVGIEGQPMDTAFHPDRRSVLAKLVEYRMHILGLRMARTATLMRRHSPSPSRTPSNASAVATAVFDDSSSPTSPTDLSLLPGATVAKLTEAYGPALTMIFLASPGLWGDSTMTPIERRFLAACAERGADCVSTRDAMNAERARGHVSHGGSTFGIGNGHLNATGHRVVAELMWDRMRAR